MSNRLLQSFDEDDDLFSSPSPDNELWSGDELWSDAGDNFITYTQTDLEQFVKPVLIGLAVLIATFALIRMTEIAGYSSYRTAADPTLVLRGTDVDKLEPDAAVIRGKEIIGSVSECGYENGRPVAVLELDTNQELADDEHCHVEKVGSLWSGNYVVKVTSDGFDGPVRFLDTDSGIDDLPTRLPSMAMILVALVVVITVCTIVYRIIKSSMFWIVAALAAIAILYFLSQQGFSPWEYLDADQFPPNFFEE